MNFLSHHELAVHPVFSLVLEYSLILFLTEVLYLPIQALNAQSRAILMAKLDRTGIATRYVFVISFMFFSEIHMFHKFNLSYFCSIAGSLGVSMVNGSAANQQVVSLPVIGQPAVPIPAVTAPVIPAPVSEFIGYPSECLLLKNMFDPATEVCDLLVLLSAHFYELLILMLFSIL